MYAQKRTKKKTPIFMLTLKSERVQTLVICKWEKETHPISLLN